MSLADVMTVAKREWVTPEELWLLHDVVDPDALDALCTAAEISVTFPYERSLVTVTADESISLEKHS
ncbi:HalOD1 output domain-containing protein [Natrinema marinum]|uniref:HalOD1 output domain-containing protein n=1 Tax=Natrinema marinum TaxID=2961598 RepID=UPI0020C8DD88|nr:HalOD1 output domain-containing protein [Natrinema marinum]